MPQLLIPHPDRQLRLVNDWSLGRDGRRREHWETIGDKLPAGSIVRLGIDKGGWPQRVRLYVDSIPGVQLPLEGSKAHPTRSMVSVLIAPELVQGLQVDFIV